MKNQSQTQTQNQTNEELKDIRIDGFDKDTHRIANKHMLYVGTDQNGDYYRTTTQQYKNFHNEMKKFVNTKIDEDK